MSIFPPRRPWTFAGVGAAGVAVLLAWAAFDRDVPAVAASEVIVVRTPPVAAVTAPDPTSAPPPKRLQPPTPPPIADTAPAAPDAFVGRWTGRDAAALTITRTAADRYAVGWMSGDAQEVFDGVLRDGRIHIERGIDGDWIQASTADPCLHLGTGGRFCRTR